MSEEKMKQRLERITKLDHNELLKEYKQKTSSPIGFGDVFMRQRLMQIEQEAELGGLTQIEKDMLARVYGREKQKHKARVEPVRGAIYSRVYKGKLIEVKSTGDGLYEYEGNQYSSLTACVKVITGNHLSGKKFFKI